MGPALHEATRGEVVAIDGDTLRRSFDVASGLPALHMVSAWATENRLMLGEIPAADKSNEITAVPEPLEILELTGASVPLDAMGCQKEIAARVRERKADYAPAVKENQPHLHEDLRTHLDRVLEAEESLPKTHRRRRTERNRGRIEDRVCIATPVPETRRNRDDWRDLKSVGCIVATTRRGAKETIEVRRLISSLRPDARRLAAAARAHWGVQNSQHWVLDAVFHEDQCRARPGKAAENFALLRRLAMNLIRKEAAKVSSFKIKSRNAGWNDQLMLQILTAGST